MLLEKPIDMGWANLPRGDMLLQEPSSEVRHHSTIQAHGIGGVPAAAQIASKGLETYVKLGPDIRFTVAGPLRHVFWFIASPGKPSGFQDFAILPPTKLSPKKKLKSATSESVWCT